MDELRVNRREFLSLSSVAGVFVWAGGTDALQRLQRASDAISWPRPREDLQPPDFYRIGWERRIPGFTLPDWFLEARVQAHTRLGRNWIPYETFDAATRWLSALDVPAYTRHVKTGPEPPWWVGTGRAPELGVARLRAMVEDAHAVGVRLIAYYWHMSEAEIASTRPEWVCREVDGGVAESQRGTQLDITGGYREVVLERLLTLAELGFDGIYFDSRHLPDRGCFGSELAQMFVATTGLAAPESADERDPVYRRFLDFQAYRLEELFNYWRGEVKVRYPHVVFIVSTSVLPALSNRRVTTNLVRIADSAKNEYSLALNRTANLGVFHRRGAFAPPPNDIRMAVGWALLRDSAQGRPPHIWIAHLEQEEEVLAATAAVLAYGCIANIDIAERTLSRLPQRGGDAERVRKAFGWSPIVARAMINRRPLRWGGVLFSELARNNRDGDALAAWRDVLWPVTGAFGVFVREGLPVAVLDDFQLQRGDVDGFHVLFVPTPDDLTPDQAAVVSRVADAGGHVVANDATWDWTGAGVEAGRELSERLRELASTSPLVTDWRGQRGHAVAYAGNGHLVALVNDFAWVRGGTDPYSSRGAPGTPPAPLRDVTVHFADVPMSSTVTDLIGGQPLDIRRNGSGLEVHVESVATFALLAVIP